MIIKPPISWPRRDNWADKRQSRHPDGWTSSRPSDFATSAEIDNLIRALQQLRETKAGVARRRVTDAIKQLRNDTFPFAAEPLEARQLASRWIADARLRTTCSSRRGTGIATIVPSMTRRGQWSYSGVPQLRASSQRRGQCERSWRRKKSHQLQPHKCPLARRCRSRFNGDFHDTRAMTRFRSRSSWRWVGTTKQGCADKHNGETKWTDQDTQAQLSSRSKTLWMGRNRKRSR